MGNKTLAGIPVLPPHSTAVRWRRTQVFQALVRDDYNVLVWP